jgi:pyrroline-5-carboxylate reductase
MTRMLLEVRRMAVIGAGNMGAALIGGVLKSGLTDAAHLQATVRTEERARELRERFKIQVCAGGNREAAEASDLIVLAVKPYTLPRVLEEIREVLRPTQILVSVAAAVPLRLIEEHLSQPMPVIRAMPNIPVVVEEGATALAANRQALPEHLEIVERMFKAVGATVFVEEDLMHAVTALSGSGPAYIYMVIEALIAGGLKVGLSREISTRLAEQTVLGAAKLVRETMLHPAILKDQVITPGGVTISAIHELERCGLRAMLISAIETATNHSRKLAQKVESRQG